MATSTCTSASGGCCRIPLPRRRGCCTIAGPPSRAILRTSRRPRAPPWAHSAGRSAYRSLSFTPRFVDFDRDGHADILVASDSESTRLFWNNGDGTFTDGTPADRRQSWASATWGWPSATSTATACSIGLPPIFVTPAIATDSGTGCFAISETACFSNRRSSSGVRDAGWGWGTEMFDYDNDKDRRHRGDERLLHLGRVSTDRSSAPVEQQRRGRIADYLYRRRQQTWA